MADPIGNFPLYRVIELARQASEARVWTPFEDEDGNRCPPIDERPVLVFLNGYVDILDHEGRQGGGWGIRIGWYDHEKRFWRAGTTTGERFVTHWMELPGPPQREENDHE